MILRLLKLEYLKFRYNRVIQLLLLLFMVFMPTTILVLKNFQDLPPPLPSVDSVFEFPLIWDYQGYSGSWLVFFCIGFIMLYTITSEINNKTMRQNIITGITKKEYFVAKGIILLVLSIFSTLLYSISTLIIGLTHTESPDFLLIADNNWAPLRYFLLCLGYTSFALMIGFLIRRGTLALLFYFSYIMMLEPILRWAVHFNITKDRGMLFWPMNVFEDLMPLPLFKLSESAIKTNTDINLLLSYWEAVTVSPIYILAFVAIAYYNFVKKDL